MKKNIILALLLMAFGLNINAQSTSEENVDPELGLKGGADMHFGIAAGLAATDPNLGGYVYLDGGGANFGPFQWSLFKFSGSMFVSSGVEDYDDVNITNLDINTVLYLRSPIVRPYVGLGIGYEAIEYTESGGGESGSQSHVPVYFSLGARATIIPFIKPFAEIRVRTASLYDEAENPIYEIDGRTMIVAGLSFKF